MNRQPFGVPPRRWEPRLNPRFVRLSRGWRRRRLRRRQRIVSVQTRGIEHLQRPLRDGMGVMITPNHSAHYDSAALYLAADEIRQPLYFLAAWQVFAMSPKIESWCLQRMGCFSIDREGTDRFAYRRAVNILQRDKHPLVVFPEGDIYHFSDRVMPFREGAAAIASTAARRSPRPIAIVPCAIKFRYAEDPTRAMCETMSQLERQLHLRPVTNLALPKRILRFAEALLSVKEIDYVGHVTQGTVQERQDRLANTILQRLESKYQLRVHDETIPERVKSLRQLIIQTAESTGAGPQVRSSILPIVDFEQEMEDLYFVIQLYSYPGEELLESPTIERMAETLDKLEEDVLQYSEPSVRGRRQARIEFGESIAVGPAAGRQSVADLTLLMQSRVQDLLDHIDDSFALHSTFGASSRPQGVLAKTH